MINIILQRIASLIPVLLGITIITFFLVRLVPGDVVDVVLGEVQLNDPVVAAAMREYFGLDQPVTVQFARWFGGLLQGDFGVSMRSGRPIVTEILERFPRTLELTIAALIISLVIAVPIGVLSATRRNTLLDQGARAVSLLGISMPDFWLGILLILFFAVQLRILPSGGYSDPDSGIWEHLRFLILPAFALAAGMAAITMRLVRSGMITVLHQDYIRTARSKGLSPARVVYRHALRNALIPVITVVGIQIGRLLGGTVVIETMFSWPGLGSMIVRAIQQRDYPMVQGSVMFLAFVFVLANLLVDLCYVFLDPRLRND
jgi:peptide/nickel transport system permease protein